VQLQLEDELSPSSGGTSSSGIEGDPLEEYELPHEENELKLELELELLGLSDEDDDELELSEEELSEGAELSLGRLG
jgi:hypothetical protein